MKAFALILIIASFLVGAFLSSLDPQTVNWAFMVPTLGAGLVGLWLHRRAAHSEIRAGRRLADNIQLLGSCLDNVRRNLDAVCARGDDLPVYEARFEIDRLFRDDLSRFAEARESYRAAMECEDFSRQTPFAIRGKHLLIYASCVDELSRALAALKGSVA